MRCSREMNTRRSSSEGVLDGVSTTLFARVTMRTVRGITAAQSGGAQ